MVTVLSYVYLCRYVFVKICVIIVVKLVISKEKYKSRVGSSVLKGDSESETILTLLVSNLYRER